MKLSPLLLVASLIANAVLVAFVVRKPETPAAAAPATSVARATPTGDKAADALRAALASGDAAALEKAGVPPDVARQLVLGRALERFAAKMRGSQSSADGKWWRNRGLASASREDLALARRELADALVAAFGDDFGMGGADAASLAFLSPEKRAALRRITQDYDEMMAKFSATGLQLPSDREKLKLLRAERDRDIAALLSPAELADYELRTSPAAASIRARYGDAIESEEEFRRIVALQKAFDDRFPREAMQGRVTPELLQQRSAAERQLQDDIRAAIGDDRYAALRRATDGDLRNVDSLAQRLNLPADTGDRVAALRENFAAQSQRISSDTSLTPQQRRDQIQALASQARTAVSQVLPGEAGDTYAQRSPWLSMLQGGMAYSTSPQASSGMTLGSGQSVFPVMPAGVNVGGPGATRQVVNFVNSSGGATDGGGGLFVTPTTPRVIENQVVSVITTSAGTTTTTAPVVVPAPNAPATNQPTPTPTPRP